MVLALAKYPFLDGAGEYLRKSQFNLEELENPITRYIIERAVNRIETALSGKIYDKIELREEVEVLTFLAALIIIKAAGMESLLRKFALGEARRTEKLLIADLKNTKGSQEREILKMFYDLFRLKVDIGDGGRFYKISITDYLLRAVHFHEQEWDLINKLVHDGYVYLDKDEIVRLVRNELASLIHYRIKIMNLTEPPQVVREKADDIRSRYAPAPSANSFLVTDYPPCIKHAIEVMNKGENLPHSGRVMLATYMLAVGKTTEEIVSLFQNAPDFNEKITRYQVEHLAGTKGNRTKYSVPSCEKIRNNSLCFATSECTGIFNPVQFGRKWKNESSRDK